MNNLKDILKSALMMTTLVLALSLVAGNVQASDNLDELRAELSQVVTKTKIKTANGGEKSFYSLKGKNEQKKQNLKLFVSKDAGFNMSTGFLAGFSF